MKKTLISVFMLALSPVLLAQAPAVVSEATPLVEGAGTVDILKADGTVLHGRKILGMTPDALRLMTDDGIRKIPLDTLHPNSLTKLASMMESPEEQQARLQREAAAAQTYRENQALKERMTAEENAQRGASMRADEARQEAARQAAAAAYAQQQLAAQEMLRQMDAAKAQRRDERAARIAAADREDAMRQQQYEREMAAANAAAAAAAAQRAAAQPVGPGPLAAMMPAHTREASGVDKLDLNEQTALKGWVDHPSKTPLPTHTWEPKLTPTEKQALTTWLDQKWFANLPPAMRMQMQGKQMPIIQLPIDTYIEGHFVGFEKGRIFDLGNKQSWQQTEEKTSRFPPSYGPGLTKVHIRLHGTTYYMTVEGAGEIIVKPVAR